MVEKGNDISEFVDKDFIIGIYDNGKVNEYSIDDLLPHAFKM